MNSREMPDPVELAIGRVLDAERVAQEAISAANADAQARLAAVHAQARLIVERAEARLARARQSADARIAAREAQVDARVRELRADVLPASSEDERIDRAVASLAAALTTTGKP